MRTSEGAGGTGKNHVPIVSNRWILDGWPEPPDDSVVGTPDRRPGSVRRTAHVEVSWPAGGEGPMRLLGRGRDLLTPVGGEPRLLAYDEMDLEVQAETVTDVTVRPGRNWVEKLVGSHSSKGFRSTLSAAVPDADEQGRPLYTMLDDVAMVSRIAGIAWSQHSPSFSADGTDRSEKLDEVRARIRRGPVPCSGLRPEGYNAISFEKQIRWPHYFRVAGDLNRSDDPLAWHEIDRAPVVCFRRRRRMDVWRAPDSIEVDAHYRDSVWGAGQTELSLHEYSLGATIDPKSYVLLGVQVLPRVLPFPECPSAARHATQLVGSTIEGFRTGVGESLRGLECCTHLNDMLRQLAEVSGLVSRL